jgi:hypothetical protein
MGILANVPRYRSRLAIFRRETMPAKSLVHGTHDTGQQGVFLSRPKRARCHSPSRPDQPGQIPDPPRKTSVHREQKPHAGKPRPSQEDNSVRKNFSQKVSGTRHASDDAVESPLAA